MKPRSTTIARTPTTPFITMEEQEERPSEFLETAEWGRKAILAGWLMATLGIAGYVYTLLRAGDDTGILDALRRGGPIGWASAFLLAGGVVVWIAGNIALMRALANDDQSFEP